MYCPHSYTHIHPLADFLSCNDPFSPCFDAWLLCCCPCFFLTSATLVLHCIALSLCCKAASAATAFRENYRSFYCYCHLAAPNLNLSRSEKFLGVSYKSPALATKSTDATWRHPSSCTQAEM